MHSCSKTLIMIIQTGKVVPVYNFLITEDILI